MDSNRLPRIWNYGRYSSDNYGAHTLCVTVCGFNFWYSYETIIAFQIPGHGVIVSENCWGPTTGKHLNWVSPFYCKRFPREEFEEKLNEAVNLLEFGDEITWDKGTDKHIPAMVEQELFRESL